MADKKHHGNGNGGGNGHLPDLTKIKNPGIVFERRDVKVKSIIGFGIGLAVATFLVAIAMQFLFDYFDNREKTEQKTESLSLIKGASNPQIPPEPRLQAMKAKEGGEAFDKSGPEDMQEFLNNEGLRLGTKKTDDEGKQILFTPVVTDPATNAVTIPIDEAMKKIAAMNFKVDPNAPTTDQPSAARQEVANDDTLPSDANSGRTMQKVRRQ
ncbi:MAG TPA: hypothetical protein VFC63_04730 [Blastocatellia bacterium]|nr:hypothetical protein [Blastocatellia bacterium]